MTVASRIAVMDHGKLVQVSTPGEIYEAPQSRYVAEFIGEVNLIEGKVVSANGGSADIASAADATQFRARTSEPLASGQQVWLSLRPEKVRVTLDKPTLENAIPGKVVDIGYLGSITHYHVRTPSGQKLTALRANSAHAVERTVNWDDDVWLEWPADAGIVLTR
jgi:putrescine transport system ATP-binding protein